MFINATHSFILKVTVVFLVAGLTACATQPDPRFPNKPTTIKPLVPKAPVVEPVPKSISITNIEDKMWQLVTLTSGVKISAIQDGAFISFQSSDQRVKGSTGCNRLMGRYQVTGQQLTLTDIASTKIFCPSGGIIQEALFIQALNDTTSWKVESNLLFLLNQQGDNVAVFELR